MIIPVAAMQLALADMDRTQMLIMVSYLSAFVSEETFSAAATLANT